MGRSGVASVTTPTHSGQKTQRRGRRPAVRNERENGGSRRGDSRVTGGSRPRSPQPGHKMAAARLGFAVPDRGAGVECRRPGPRPAAEDLAAGSAGAGEGETGSQKP